MNSESAFLFSTFNELYKCWRSGTNARLFIESVNGKAFVNFSAFLGDPDDVHLKPRQPKRNPSKPRKKSTKKIKRDNDRAARFQESKRKEKEAASASKSVDNPETNATSSPGAESAMTVSDLEFSFSSPLPENLRQDTSQDTSMIVNDNIEHRKQDDVLDSIYSSESRGEEEEVQEHNPSSSISEHDNSTNNSSSVAQGNFQKSYAAAAANNFNPTNKNEEGVQEHKGFKLSIDSDTHKNIKTSSMNLVYKAGINMFEILKKEDFVDEELIISLDTSERIKFIPVGICSDLTGELKKSFTKRYIVTNRGELIEMSQDSRSKMNRAIIEVVEQVRNLFKVLKQEDLASDTLNVNIQFLRDFSHRH